MLQGFFGTTLKRLWPQTSKDHKKTTFRGTFFGYMFDIFSYFSDGHFFVCFLNLSRTRFWRQRHPQASISKGFGCLLEHTLNTSEKAKTPIPCRMGCENQALEGFCFTLFCHFHVQVSGPLFFMIRLMICHNFTNLCLHWKPIFNNILQLFRPSFSST